MGKFSNDVNHHIQGVEQALERALDYLRAVDGDREIVKFLPGVIDNIVCVMPGQAREELSEELKRWLDEIVSRKMRKNGF